MNTNSGFWILAGAAAAALVALLVTTQWHEARSLPQVKFSIPSRPVGPIAGDLNREFVTVANRGKTPADVSGWLLSNKTGDTYVFPEGLVLPAGGVITVYSGCGEDGVDALHWCLEKEIWSDLSDKVTLRMTDGTLVDTYSYVHRCTRCEKG